VSFEKANHDDTRDAKYNVLKQIKPPSKDDCVVGQYEGYSYQGEKSHTPTYAAIKLWVDNDRWRGVPFYLIAGKALDRRLVQVKVGFKDFDRSCFASCCSGMKSTTNAELLIQVQPQQIVQFTLNEKRKGYTNKSVKSYLDEISGGSHDVVNNEYSTLIFDSLKGDSSCFVRDDELQRAWEIFTPLLHEVALAPIYNYKFGSSGPKEVEELLRPYNANAPEFNMSRL
jgi:glucose-6-phosphate 1-dehydrogenase